MDKRILGYIMSAGLFNGINESELAKLLSELNAQTMSFDANCLMLCEGDGNRYISVILEGSAVGERTGSEGRVTTVNELRAGDSFGDVLSGAEVKSPVTVRATERCLVLRFLFDDIFLASCTASGAVSKLLRNLISEISEKYFVLNRRIVVLTGSTLRSKAARYLCEITDNFSNAEIVDRRTREEQARYLGCDRSALSRELSVLKHLGAIDYKGCRFNILNAEALREIAEL